VNPPPTGSTGPAIDGSPPGLREGVRRLAVVPLLAVYLAGPAWVVLVSPAIPGLLRIALLTLAGLAALAPRWSPTILLGLVPLLPIWPALMPALPDGLVHLVVATQAVPWLVRRLLGHRGVGNSMVPGWGLFAAVGTVSLLVGLTPEPWRGLDLPHVWRLVAAHVPSYIFEADHARGSSTWLVWTVMVDGLMCALIVGWAVNRQTRLLALRAVAVSAVLTALFGMWQAVTGLGLQTAWMVFDAGIVRINATYIDPNALAAFYALVAPVLAGLAMQALGWRRVAWSVGLVLVLVAVVMTAGRAGLVALAVGLLAMAWVALRHGLDEIDATRVVRRHFRWAVRATLVALVAGLLLLVAVGSALNVRHEQQTSYLHTWLYTFNVRQPADAIAKGRIAVWEVALGLIREHPLVGQGIGAAPGQFERMRADLGIETLPHDARLSPHNTYLLVTSELGALGLAAFLLMFWAVVIGVRARDNLRDREAATWPVTGLVGGLVGYSLTMLTGDRILLREDVVVGVICASLATIAAPPLPRRWRYAAAIVLLVALASWPVRTGWVHGGPQLRRVPPHEGLHPEQVGSRGETYRWTTGEALFYVPAGARRVTIPVRNLSPVSQRLDVTVDGRPADLQYLEPGPWVTLDYRLPPPPDGRWHAIGLRISPTWRAPGDARTLGVVVGAWQYEPR